MNQVMDTAVSLTQLLESAITKLERRDDARRSLTIV